MSRNQAPGPDSSRPARSHGRRKRAADTRVRTVLLTATSSAELPQPGALGGYFRPLPLPGAVVGAVVLSVATVFDRGLPELDAFEIGARGVGVVLRARALLDLIHERARLGVRRRLSVGEGLLRLDLRLRYPVHPFVGAVRMLRVRREHPRVRPACRTLEGYHFADV